MRKVSATAPLSRDHAVWVPAFAGTTKKLFGFNCQTARGCASAFSRRHAPELCQKFLAPEIRGRREDRVRAAPAVPCALRTEERAHEHTGSAGASRPSLRSGFTAYNVISPVNGSFATVIPENLAAQELDASTAASGPHDFTVRLMRARLLRNPRPPHPTARS